MELDDLKTAWQEMERRLDKSDALNTRLITQTHLDKAYSAIRRFGLAQTVELAIWFAVVVTVAPFWIEHRATTHLLVSGLVLHAYGVAAICAGVVQLLMIARIRYTGPVLVMQKRISQLRRVRIQSTLALGLPWWWLWIPASIVGTKWLFDVDIYAFGWVAASLAFGAGGMLLTLLLARRHINRPGASALVRRLADDFAGCSLNRARQELAELERFARR